MEYKTIYKDGKPAGKFERAKAKIIASNQTQTSPRWINILRTEKENYIAEHCSCRYGESNWCEVIEKEEVIEYLEEWGYPLEEIKREFPSYETKSKEKKDKKEIEFLAPNGETYSPEKFFHNCFFCDRCGAVDWKEFARISPDGRLYCEQCFEAHCFMCSRCNATFWEEDAYIWDFRWYCEKCTEEIEELRRKSEKKLHP